MTREITDETQLDWLWKKLQNIPFTATSKAYYEEAITEVAGLTHRLDDVWSPSEDPPTPAAAGNDITAVVLGSMAVISATDNRSWDSGHTGWVEPGYGGSDYAVRIYDDNDDEITFAAATNWFFDYKSGVLHADVDPEDEGWKLPLKISGLYWTGKNANEVLYLDEEGSAPSTPQTSRWGLYFKSDGLYTLEDDGTEVGPLGTGGGGSLSGLSDVDSATQTDGFVIQSTGGNYLGAQLDHTKLGTIGSNTHAQIDTHIAAAGDYLPLAGGTMSGDIDMGILYDILNASLVDSTTITNSGSLTTSSLSVTGGVIPITRTGNTAATGAQLFLFRQRTAGAPELLSGDVIGDIQVFGNDGSAALSAALTFTATQNWSGAAQGTRMGVFLTADSEADDQNEVLRLTSVASATTYLEIRSGDGSTNFPQILSSGSDVGMYTTGGGSVAIDGNDITATGDLDVTGDITGTFTGLTGNMAVETNGDGDIIASAITAAELGYLNDLTGNIQDQLDGKGHLYDTKTIWIKHPQADEEAPFLFVPTEYSVEITQIEVIRSGGTDLTLEIYECPKDDFNTSDAGASILSATKTVTTSQTDAAIADGTIAVDKKVWWSIASVTGSVTDLMIDVTYYKVDAP